MAKAKNEPSSRAPRVAIAIMAAGKGTRLKSKHPKVLHEVGGKALLSHVIASAAKVVPAKDVFAIIGHEADRVREIVAGSGVNFVLQAEQHGTDTPSWSPAKPSPPTTLCSFFPGRAFDYPKTITDLRDFHASKKAAMTLLSARLEDPTGYGR